MIDDFGVISAKRTFKGYSEEHRMIKVNEFLSLSERKTISGRFPFDWTKSIKRIKIPHQKQDCLDSNNGKLCKDCNIKTEMICFNWEMTRNCISCLNLVSQKKTNSIDNNMF